MTHREAFEKAKAHLLQQNQHALLPHSIRLACAYRGENGLKCAIGCLIPDEQYKPEFESRSAAFIAGQVPALAGLNTGFLDDLQQVHDNYEPADWPIYLKDFEEEYVHLLSL